MTAADISPRVRAVADAVLYEGYLLYPYRGSSRKNQSRWQFGVLGPPGAAAAGVGEEPALSAQLLTEGGEDEGVTLVLRFLQLQTRHVQEPVEGGGWRTVDELAAGAQRWLSWDEAVEREVAFAPVRLPELVAPRTIPVAVDGGVDVEELAGPGRIMRTRQPLAAEVTLSRTEDDGFARLGVEVRNTGPEITGPGTTDKEDAIARSLIGAHVIATVAGGSFVSLLEPPAEAAAAVARCTHRRCFPVLAGEPGTRDTVLVSPIILYDYPEVAQESDGALFDSTEIDEILTLRVMTMTDEEKAQARATDPLAARIVDRCDAMTPEALGQLHGILRDPRADPGLIPELPEGVPWWDPEADTSVRPDVDAVLVNGVRVAKGSAVRLRPSRRADAQDLFFAGRTATVASVHSDVDGNTHVGVTVDDDPAAELHDWYGRYLYFAPDELEPLGEPAPGREEGQSWRQ
ncbi:hypothetical protein [Rhodococcus tukisamuensis]|uniref:Uncharacterized protein n=1 Tax=Rhodococcus tukisamuensis TaxID=168276 RepID=A0A1G6UR72_9NOCA|nr:hypothetical protein [Rhodococcus tukisamuensis]SDD43057.1 hypothetical protein SAMN05444580_104253 [Rhodococcus tukisamuensis]